MSDVFGTDYARAYDAIYHEKDYTAECDLLEQIFKKYSASPVRNVLDLGCGTGNHTLRLAERGYSVTGVDCAPEMLAIARDKAEQQGLKIALHEADIRRINLERTFDTVLMMFAVLGYQVENADVLLALRAAREHLRPGGLLVADVWYGPAVLVQRPGNRTRTIRDGDTAIVRESSAELDIRHHTCRVHFSLHRKRDKELLAETEEEHRMRFFFPKELEFFLETSGFQLLRLGAFPDFEREPDENTWNAILAAKAT